MVDLKVKGDLHSKQSAPGRALIPDQELAQLTTMLLCMGGAAQYKEKTLEQAP
jgi:hypothetical protein